MLKRISTIALVALFVFALFSNQAHADVTQIPWGGQGSFNLPCPGGAHWVLTPGFGVTSATIGIDTHDWGMVQAWDSQESWYTDTGPVISVSSVMLAYLGMGNEANQLILTGCVGGPTPTPPPPAPGPGPSGPSPSPSPSPTPSPTPQVSNQHQAIVLCKTWTWKKAHHVRLVSFSRTGVSIYRCGR